MRNHLLTLGAIALFLPSIALAGENAPQTSAAARNDASRILCRNVGGQGKITKTVCMPARAWEEKRRHDQEGLKQTQQRAAQSGIHM